MYVKLVKMAHALRRKGHTKIGISMLFEVLRWKRHLQTDDVTGFRLNDNYRSRYARLIMKNEPTLAAFFKTRVLRARKEKA